MKGRFDRWQRWGGMLAVLVAVLMLAQPATAATTSVVSNLFFGSQLLSDFSSEFLFNVNGDDNIVDVGDVLVAIFDVNRTTDVNGTQNTFGKGTTVDELTGVLAIQVTSATQDATGNWTFTFSPVSAANRTALAAAYPTLGGAINSWSAGTMAAFYDDPDQDFTFAGPGTIDSLGATAVDGTELWEVGFNGSTGEGWVATNVVSNDITVVGSTPVPAAGGLVNFGVNVLVNNTGLEFREVATIFGGTADISGSGTLLGISGAPTPFQVYDNFNLRIDVVPEPSSLAAMSGLLLVGLVGSLRTWRSRKNAV